MTQSQTAADHASSKAWSFSQWPLRAKLAAALIFPVLLAFGLGALRVKGELDQERQFARAADSTVLLRPLAEFNLAVQRLAASSAPGGQGLKASAGAYDRAATDVTRALNEATVSEAVQTKTKTALSLGKAVRQAAGQTGALSVAIDKSASTAALVSSIIGDLGLNDVSSVKTLVALQDTIAAQRAMTGQQLNLANKDDASGGQNAVKLVGAEGSFVTRLKDEAATTNASDIRQLINENTARGVYLQAATLSEEQLPVVADAFQRSNTAYGSLLNRQLSEFEADLRSQANEHRAQALVNIGLVVLALLAALFIVLALLRSLLVPLRTVRQGALDIARNRLPDAVRRIREGEEPPAFKPIPVHTTEEMGQLARAVDDLHQQALTLAGEQARLRVQVGHMFETLSRRSTSLIEQQLTLIERLESNEEDPQRLQSLFRLDHLAARMRRNSDSLLVLAGTTTRRGGARSVSVADAVRAAVSEVEEYQRIDIGETSDDHVLSSVGSDLIHMLAEIVDNALSYSPPTSRVAIRGARTSEGGVLIEVRDAGLGMPPAVLGGLNERLADGGDITTDTARRMGLFVVGSLAKRHGIGVRLRRNDEPGQSGVTVSVHLPGVLLAQKAAKPSIAGPRAASQINGAAAPASSPVRTNGAAAPQSSPAAPAGAPGSAPVEPVKGPNGLPSRKPMATGTTAPDAAATATASKSPADEAPAPRTSTGLPSRRPGATRITELTGAGPAPARPAPAPKPSAPAAPTAPVATAAPAAVEQPVVEQSAAEAPRTTTGLPVRKPMATGITEHTGTPATRAEAAAEAAAEQGKRGWLRRPSRKAAEEATAARKDAASAEAEEAEHRMPANLTAWLDHRAKLAAARAEAEGKAEGEATEAASTSAAPEQAASPSATPESSAPASQAPVAAPAPSHAVSPSEGFSAAAAALAPADQATTPFNAFGVQRAGVSQVTAPEAPQAAAPVAQEPTLASGLPRRQPGASGIQPNDSVPSPEDPPIFRAMGSPWLANLDGGHVDSSRPPAAVDGGPSAPDAPSGLPVRRPGGSFATGVADAAEAAQPSARAGRDPESIRRSLNRHQTGVSSARTQTPLNGTPDREEADVPH